MDKIYINNLEFIGYHGVFEEEKKLGQKFQVSLELFLNTREAGKTEDLTKSVHYGLVAKDVEKIFLEKSYDLLETLAEKIAETLLIKYPLIQEIAVKITKPWAPLQMIFQDVAVEIRRKRHRLYLSLGTNMGERENNLKNALFHINEMENTHVTKESKIYKTKPYGFTAQDDFLNICVEVESLLSAQEFLKEILAIEIEMGRVREFKWGPRLIDIDILFYDDEIIEDENLIVPHPYIYDREFVLEPLCEIARNYLHPVDRKRVWQMLDELRARTPKQEFCNIWECRDREIELGKKTLIMGILNVTPDSFSDGGDHNDIKRAVEHAKLMISEGADIIDVGGESTRPGHIKITEEEEIKRVVPIIRELSKLDTIISIDTYKYKVAEEAIKAGATIINDVWGLQYDNGEMASIAKKYNVGIVAMHNQDGTYYKEDIMSSMRKFFNRSYEIADKFDISRDKIILDPGIGFGKTGEQNIEVLSRLAEIKDMGRLLLGTSRKRFLGTILDKENPKERDIGTLATTIYGISNGVDIVRVHNVGKNYEAIKVADKIIRKG